MDMLLGQRVLHKGDARITIGNRKIDWSKVNNIMIKKGDVENRSRDDIMRGVLTYLNDGGVDSRFRFSYIIRGTSMTNRKVLGRMQNQGLIVIRPVLEEEKVKYHLHGSIKEVCEITDKGRKYLRLIEGMAKLIEKPGNIRYRYKEYGLAVEKRKKKK